MASEEEVICCPMCYNELDDKDRVTVVTPCKHSACKTCLESWLLRKGGTDSVPTTGKCPLCRADINIFQLVSAVDGKNIYPKNTDLSTSRLPGHVMVVSEVLSPPLVNDFVALAGLTIHFPDDGSIPFVYEPDGEEEVDDEMENDDKQAGRKKYFEEGCHWHDKSSTFHGRLSWSRQFDADKQQSDEYVDLILQASSDMRYVCGGSITMNRGWTPLDGKWKINMRDLNRTTYAEIDVRSGCFMLKGEKYRINFSEKQPFFLMSNYGIRAVVTTGINCETSGCYSDCIIEDKIEWKHEWKHGDLQGSNISTWVRQESFKACNDVLSEKLSIGGDVGLMIREKNNYFRRIDASVVYVSETIWGNTFVQDFSVGLASYHFIEENGEGLEGAYISYESPQCSVWPNLDDGSPVPYRVPFTNVHWDAATRTFEGTIEWRRLYGCGWQGDDMWTYKMVFDRNYLCIVSGGVVSSTNGVDSGRNHRYDDGLMYKNWKASERLMQDFTADEMNEMISTLTTMTDGDPDSLDNVLVEEMLADGASYEHVAYVLLNARLRRGLFS